MKTENITRRNFLKSSLGLAASVGIANVLPRNVLASQCELTPEQPEGPFYPVEEQLDKDNDLTYVETKVAKARGQVIYVLGQVTDENCNPVPKAFVEIWQACESGKYNHAGDPNPAPLDPNFQYWGKNLTDEKGNYLFKTIIPGDYPASSTWMRPAHIHFKVAKIGFHELITQMYFKGNKYNANDRILRSLPKAEQARVIVTLEEPTKDFDPKSKVCRFDIVLREVE